MTDVDGTRIGVPSIEFNTDVALSKNFDIVELETLFDRAPSLEFDLFSPYRAQFHHLIFISKGSCSHFIDFVHHRCAEGNVILLTKNQIHAFDKVNRPAGTMLLFTSDFLDSISANVRLPANVLNFNSYEKSPVYAPSPQLTSYCELVINELRQIESGAVLNELSLRLLFATLLIKLSTGNGMPGDASTNDVDRKHVNRFMALIEQDYSTAKDASVYAEFMGITYKTLNRICRQIVGMSPK